ncbi:MAG: CopG family transcriptional regulator [Candidatus Dormibacteraceae bacterium]
MERQNITLALPRSLLRRVKVVAAQQDTSVSALLTATLEQMVRDDADREAAARRLVERMRIGYDLGTQGQIALSRDELHER